MDDELERIKRLTGFDPLTETGRAFKFFMNKVLQAEADDEQQRAELVAKVRRIAEHIDASQKEKKDVTNALKRGVLQTLKSLKWID